VNTSIDDLRNEVNDRFNVTDRRISRVGAMTSAMANVAASAAGVRTPNRFAASAGFIGGESAFALGYQHAFSDRATITISGAFAQGENGGTIGFGYGW
jgi:autotransporter adhesin